MTALDRARLVKLAELLLARITDDSMSEVSLFEAIREQGFSDDEADDILVEMVQFFSVPMPHRPYTGTELDELYRQEVLRRNG